MKQWIRRARRHIGVPAVLFSFALLAGGGVLLAQAASALPAEVPASVAGRVILSTESSPADLLEIAAGRPAHWEITARLEDATDATVRLGLRGSDGAVDLSQGIDIAVASCSEPWDEVAGEPLCRPGGDRLALGGGEGGADAAGPVFDAAPARPGSPSHLLVSLSVDARAGGRAPDARNAGRDLVLSLTPVAVDGVPVEREGAPTTTVAGLLTLLAAVAVAGGVLGLGSAGRRARHPSPPESPPNGRHAPGSPPGDGS